MLVKEVCKKCVEKRQGFWVKGHEMLWNYQGVVECFRVREVQGYQNYWLRTDRWPPTNCPFYLEHLLVAGEVDPR